MWEETFLMNYSRQYIEEIGNKTGFINSNIEKVIRLLDVLRFVDSELDQGHRKLVLKGGTAINLLYFNLPRLSVDIDMDYVGSIDKETAKIDRESIMDSFDRFMLKDGYVVSTKSRNSAILASRTYSYVNAFGNKDNIKVEINFIDRTHVLGTELIGATYFGKRVVSSCPLKEELFGMKICALLDRSKPRDLYDVNNIMSMSENLNSQKLRKSVLFYLSLDGIFFLDDSIYHGMKSITQNDIKRELLPVLVRNDRFNLEQVKEKVSLWLKSLLMVTDDERKYLNEFSYGNFNPFLLFDDIDAKRAFHHPMAKWRALVCKNGKGRTKK